MGAIRMTAQVVAKMKEMPTDDPLFARHYSRRRPQDSPGYLFEVKTPAESKGPGLLKLIGTPGEQAFRPLSESACPLVKK